MSPCIELLKLIKILNSVSKIKAFVSRKNNRKNSGKFPGSGQLFFSTGIYLSLWKSIPPQQQNRINNP
jgi:hypothetical protein